MKRKIIVLVAALLLVALVVPSAYAALTSEQQQKMQDLQKQMAALQKQMIQSYADAGLLTPEQAKLMQERVDATNEYRQANPGAYGSGFCPGSGMMGGGWGRGGFGGMMGSGFRGTWGGPGASLSF